MDIVVVRRDDFDTSEAVDTAYFECIPLMVVEIVSPTNVLEKLLLKTEACLDAGVGLVWIADPRRRTVTAYRAGEKPVFFEGDEPINADPAVPNFSLPTSKLFDD